MGNVNPIDFSDKLSTLSSRLAGLAAALSFPGFLIYHTLLSLGTIEPFLGGYAAVMLSCTAAVFFAILPFRSPALFGKLSLHTIAFFVFAVFAITWSIIISQNSSFYFVEDAFYQVLSTIILLMALFFIGFYFDFDSWIARRFMPTALIVCATLLIANFITTGSIMFYAAYDAGTLNEKVATYQGYAVNTLFIAVLALGGVRTVSSRLAVIFVGLVSLFFLGSRSEFIGFAIGGLAACAFLVARTKGGIALISLFVIAGLGMWLSIDAAFTESRFAELNDIQNASSVIIRGVLNEIALAQILDNPLTGYFGGHYLAGGEGSYAHNLLSAWVTFGIIGFVLYAYLTIYPAWKGFSAIAIDRKDDPIWWSVLVLGVCVVTLVIFAKPIYWEVPGLLFGLLGQALYRHEPSPKMRSNITSE